MSRKNSHCEQGSYIIYLSLDDKNGGTHWNIKPMTSKCRHYRHIIEQTLRNEYQLHAATVDAMIYNVNKLTVEVKTV